MKPFISEEEEKEKEKLDIPEMVKNEFRNREREEGEKGEDEYIYLLHSVIVHTEQRGGYYSVYVRPQCGKDWFYFKDNDDMKISNEWNAMNENFGGK
jgi:uncharacterized UBP type Zn finger protein